jgi:transcription initiation factor TFIID TATA-box-binding protein
MIQHVKDPESAIIFFNSGKLVSTGLNDLGSVHKVLTGILQKLRDMGVSVDREADVAVQNIVASYDLHRLINLGNIAISIGKEKVEYDPDRFEGLVYRTRENSTVLLLYESGKVVCTGAKRLEDLELAMGSLLEDLESAGLMS